VSSSPSLTHPSVTSPMLSSASVSHQPDGSFYSDQESPAISEAEPSSISAAAQPSSPHETSTKGNHSILNSPLHPFYNFPILTRLTAIAFYVCFSTTISTTLGTGTAFNTTTQWLITTCYRPASSLSTRTFSFATAATAIPPDFTWAAPQYDRAQSTTAAASAPISSWS
jgi:hypothetical protein